MGDHLRQIVDRRPQRIAAVAAVWIPSAPSGAKICAPSGWVRPSATSLIGARVASQCARNILEREGRRSRCISRRDSLRFGEATGYPRIVNRRSCGRIVVPQAIAVQGVLGGDLCAIGCHKTTNSAHYTLRGIDAAHRGSYMVIDNDGTAGALLHPASMDRGPPHSGRARSLREAPATMVSGPRCAGR